MFVRGRGIEVELGGQLAIGGTVAEPSIDGRLNLRRGTIDIVTKRISFTRGVMAFRIQGERTDFVALKYACHGLSQPMDWESRRLLDDREQVERLLRRVLDFAADPRRFAACYRGLLASCQQARAAGFPLDGPLTANLRRLEHFLHQAQARLPGAARPALPCS